MWRALCVVAVMLFGVTAACTGGSAPATAPSDTTRDTSPAREATAVAVRRCSTAVAVGTSWRQHAFGAGPLTFPDGRRWTPEAFDATPPHLPDGTRFLKTPIAIDRGSRVTITLPPEERRSVALVYGDNPHARIRIDEGQYAVTFVACKAIPQAPPGNVFNGGFLLQAPRCVKLDVSYEDQTRRLVLPFGTSRCPS